MSERPTPDAEGFATLTVRVPAAVARAIRAAAAREGTSPEVAAAMWLAEHAEAVARAAVRPPAPPGAAPPEAE